MHEFSLMKSILEDVLADLRARSIDEPGQVDELHMTVGALDIHSRDSFVQAFTVAAQGTPLAGARFILNVEPALLSCPHCGYSGPVGEDEADGHLDMPVAECPECGKVTVVRGGRGIRPIELVLKEPDGMNEPEGHQPSTNDH